MSSQGPGPRFTSHPGGLPTTPAVGFISIAPPWQSPPSYAVYADVMKDGRKMLAIVARKNDAIAKLLKPHVGSLVTIYVPQFGIAWTSTLAYRRRWGYLYVRIPSRPANLKRLFEPLWKAGYPIPVIISIPPISLVQGNQPTENLKDSIKPVQG